MAARFPGLLDRVAHPRACARCGTSTTPSPRRCMDSRAPPTTGRARRRSHGCARSRVPTLVLNARNDPFIPAASLPTPRDVSRIGHARAAAPRRTRRLRQRAVFRATSIGCRRGCYTSSLALTAISTFPLTDAAARDLQGLRHPRHRRPHADAGDRAHHRPGARQPRARSQARHDRRRPRRPPVGARADRGARATASAPPAST